MNAASVLAGHLGLNPVVADTLGENDRSATGYLTRDESEATADEFFARPDESIRGWERAADAQRRIVSAVEQVITLSDANGDIAIVAHGGVGALLLCHLKGVPISRTEDQPIGGGGNFFSFDAAGRRLLSGWRPIDG
jgi:broad specificity phosphatase PhoE